MRTFLLCLLLLGHFSLAAQELPRRSFLGIQMEPLSSDMRRLIGISDSNGVLINRVLPNSTASEAGFRKGDVLVRLNDALLRQPADAVRYVGTQPGGSSFRYELIRDKQRITGKAAFKPFPKESYPDLEVIYTEAKSGTGLQRILLTKPKKQSGKLPLIVFIGGIGCYSLDAPLDTGRSELMLLNGLARNGFLTARLEKPGIGDGAGHSKPCPELSFEEETEAYVAAIKKLRQRSDVDADATYIIGHSMGGVFAPKIAAQTPIRGIVAYGTIGSGFMEYLVKTRRTIGEAFGWPPDETDAYIKDYCECAGYYFVEKMTTEEAAHKKPLCREYLSVFDFRSRAYNDQLYAINIPGLWKQYAGRALLLWGESDYISSRDDHELLAKAINFYHPNAVRFQTVKNADHGMNIAASFQAARSSAGPYNQEVGALILSWLRSQS
jgi:pimeloyl-ACP methyl ester carboxylesterase